MLQYLIGSGWCLGLLDMNGARGKMASTSCFSLFQGVQNASECCICCQSVTSLMTAASTFVVLAPCPRAFGLSLRTTREK
jgi:hypothetical protein